MLTSKERTENTAKLTLDERKQVLEDYFKQACIDPKHLAEHERDMLVSHLRGLGYHSPMFDHAFRLLLSSKRNKTNA